MSRYCLHAAQAAAGRILSYVVMHYVGGKGAAWTAEQWAFWGLALLVSLSFMHDLKFTEVRVSDESVRAQGAAQRTREAWTGLIARAA